MLKGKSSFLVYGLAIFAVVVWIFFLFSDAISESSRFSKKPQEVVVSVAEEEVIGQEKSILSEQEVISIDGASPDMEFLSSHVQEMSVDDIQYLGNLREKISLLETLYSSNKGVLELLLNSYLLDHQYHAAKKLFSSLSQEEKAKLNSRLEFLILFNSFSQEGEKEYAYLQSLVEKNSQMGIFSAAERDYYQLQFLLVAKNYSWAQQLLPSLMETEYREFAMDVQWAFEQYQSLKDVPAYYQDALLAFQLMRQESYALAKKMVLPLVNLYPNYILPYQILANADFKMHRFASSNSYFSELLELDYQEKNLYLYYLWVGNYLLGNYADAVLYLTQITDEKILLDADRYLILSYIGLEEYEKVFYNWKRLLGHSEIKETDFYTFFEEAFWSPYRHGKSSLYAPQKQQLMLPYLKLCRKNLAVEQQDVCLFGETGYLIFEGKAKAAFKDIYYLAKKYPYSGFYSYLGEIFSEVGNKQKAMVFMMKAISLSEDSEERGYLKKRLLEINRL